PLPRPRRRRPPPRLRSRPCARRAEPVRAARRRHRSAGPQRGRQDHRDLVRHRPAAPRRGHRAGARRRPVALESRAPRPSGGDDPGRRAELRRLGDAAAALRSEPARGPAGRGRGRRASGDRRVRPHPRAPALGRPAPAPGPRAGHHRATGPGVPRRADRRDGSLHPAPCAGAGPRPRPDGHRGRAHHPSHGRRRGAGRCRPCDLPGPGARLRLGAGGGPRAPCRRRRRGGAGDCQRRRPGDGPRARGRPARCGRTARRPPGGRLRRGGRSRDRAAGPDGCRPPRCGGRRERGTDLRDHPRDRGGRPMSAPRETSSPERTPRPAPPLRRILSHGDLEARILLSNAEQLMVAIALPALVLIGLWLLPLGRLDGVAAIDTAVAATFATALISTSFTSQAIITGFDRRNGVLRWVATTPLGRGGYLAGKILATLATHVLQVLVLGVIALIIGWRPELPGLLAAVPVWLTGTVAFGALGLLVAGTLRTEAVLAVSNL